jgi:DNA-directed RNA polymerase specialized sigma24 family protein
VELDEALRELLPSEAGDSADATLIAAAQEAWRRRQVNTQAGAAVIAALNERGLSYREIARLTGIPAPTAHRWARPPEEDTD